MRFPNDLFPECPLDSLTVLLFWWDWSMRSDTCLFTDLSIRFPALMDVSRHVYNDTHSGKLQMFLLLCFVTSSFFSPGKFSHVNLHELIFFPSFLHELLSLYSQLSENKDLLDFHTLWMENCLLDSSSEIHRRQLRTQNHYQSFLFVSVHSDIILLPEK